MPKRSRRTTERETVWRDEPNWDPLQRAAIEWACGPFMAMEEVLLRNGARVWCYKHSRTRRSLHLAEDLEAYLFSYDPRRPGTSGCYERVSLDEAFGRVLLQPQFESGWLAHRAFDRPWQVDEDGVEIEPLEDDRGFITGFEERMADERWTELNVRRGEADDDGQR